MRQRNTNEIYAEIQERIAALLKGHPSFRASIGLDDDQVLTMALYARELVEQGRLDHAKTLLEALADLDPENAYVHTCLGSVYMQKGEREPAIDELQRALELEPNNITANTHLSELFLESGDLEAAASYAERAVSLDPEGKSPFANRARSLAMVVVAVGKEVEAKGPEALDEIRARIVRLEDEGHA